MIDYLKLIVFPSKTFEKINDKKLDNLTLYLIWTIISATIAIPKLLATLLNNPNGLAVMIGYLLVIALIYFPFTYGLGFLYWIIAKGFKGVSSFLEMRNLMAYLMLPFILQAILSIPFTIVGLIKNDAGIILHENYLTNFILCFLSFRILMVGIAKYNKFNWMITIVVWVLATSVFGGLAYLRILLK